MTFGVKQRIKRVLFPALFRLGIYDRLLNAHHRGKVIVLCGHRVSEERPDRDGLAPLGFEVGITRASFENLVRFLCEKMHPVTLEETARFARGEQQIPDRAVALTFDDGYKDNYLNAFPILRRYGVPATVFLTTGYIDTNSLLWWDSLAELLKHTQRPSLQTHRIRALVGPNAVPLPEVLHLDSWSKKNASWHVLTSALRPCDPKVINRVIERMREQLNVDGDYHSEHHRLLTWTQIREMSENGVQFGAHTVNHPSLAHARPEQFEREVLGAKRDIEERIRKSVIAFAYPYGDLPEWGEAAKIKLAEYGFTCAFGTAAGYVSRRSDPFELKRMGAVNGHVALTAREMVVVSQEWAY